MICIHEFRQIDILKHMYITKTLGFAIFAIIMTVVHISFPIEVISILDWFLYSAFLLHLDFPPMLLLPTLT